MKRSTAIKNMHEIARRLHSINGLLATPLTSDEAFKISRVWVFGSTVKGSTSPNDLDILIEGKGVGRRRLFSFNRRGFKYKETRDCRPFLHARLDKSYLHQRGIMRAICSENEAYKWLSKGMKRVSRHSLENDDEIAWPRMMIYPKFEFIDKPIE